MRHRLVTTLTAVTTLVASGGAVAASATSGALTIQGNGLRLVPLGTSESRAVVVLDQLIGNSTTKVVATPSMKNCGVDAWGTWHALSAYFDHGRLVGIQVGPGHQPSVQTAAGLRLGDTLRRARQLYAARLTTTDANGGGWIVATSTGRIDGFVGRDGPRGPVSSSTILTIDVGNVGCPAMSP